MAYPTPIFDQLHEETGMDSFDLNDWVVEHAPQEYEAVKYLSNYEVQIEYFAEIYRQKHLT